ncbi:MAG: MFS transporter, partial [Granulosicoccaceae bacterium]
MSNQNTGAMSGSANTLLDQHKLTSTEKQAATGLVLIYVSRMLGLFMVLPVLSAYGMALEGATPALLGLALGVYGLMQAMLQIPFGMASDRFGRKPLILIGLLVFILGSIMAAYAQTIEALVVGRALQGAGAVAAAVLALAADLSREEQRTKIMAILGVSIGFAFVASLVLGPLVASWWGMAGVFWVTAGLGVVAIVALYVVVPAPVHLGCHRDAQSHLDQLGEVLKDIGLLRLDLGIFLLHAIMTGCFVVLPLALIDAGVVVDRQWTVYLPAVGIALLILVPMMGLADGKGLQREVFLASIGALTMVLVFFALANSSMQLMLAIGLFFGFFSVLEAMLPSLVSKMAPAGSKGTAMGVYSSAQFFGAFVGGALGGILYGLSGGA